MMRRPDVPILVAVWDSSGGLRQKLEHRAELLEAARERYRQLQRDLRSLFWKEKLRRDGELLIQLTQTQAEVDRALDAALRRADVEGWDPLDPFIHCLEELSLLREALVTQATRRLKLEGTRLSLEELLTRLEALQAGPRVILPGQRWTAAQELLPPSLPALLQVKEQADVLERLFQRPMNPSDSFPLREAEVETLGTVLRNMEEALQGLWRRIHQADPSGGLMRFLQRRARRAPLRTPLTGPEQLLRAAFWQDVALFRLRELCEVRLSPLKVTEAELLPAVTWLSRREVEEGTRLTPGPVLPPERVALLEMARELWSGPAGGAPGFRAGRPNAPAPRSPPLAWERLLERAHEVDATVPREQAVPLRDVLRLYVRIRSGGKEGTPAPRSLVEWVRRARDVAG